MTQKEQSQTGRRPNRLIRCASPYLQQHAYNPVDWYPWGEEAIERARRENKPIFLSIGYSSCHWCHVMERESFEDPETARLLNEGFVSIKVDREERPDVDEVYMRAVQIMTGGGGWPLNVFLTPELVPFYGGTYFPPEDQGETPGLRRALVAVRDAYGQKRDDLTTAGRQVAAAIEKSATPEGAEGELSSALFAGAVRTLSGQFDMENGGFGAEPKFPQAPVLDWLLRFWAETGDPRARLMVEMSLNKMAAGGIHDQVGGGFHRYAVDRKWRVPHFEKTLYDNAQLVWLYADASVALGQEDWRRTAAAAARYVLDDLGSPEGGFFAAQDADSEGVEGKHYVWTGQEVLDCLGAEEGGIVARYLGVTDDGNWEGGQNVLYRSMPLASLAGLFGLDEKAAGEIVARGMRRLRDRRRERPAPATDRKVLADWNCLMASALVRLSRATGDTGFLDAAVRCVDFVLGGMHEGGRLMHSWLDGTAGSPAFLADHAFLAAALIDLYESTFRMDYLRRARQAAEAIAAEHWDEETGLLGLTGRGGEELIARIRMTGDQPLPSGSSVACHVFLRLAAVGDDHGWAAKAERLLRNSLSLMEETPEGMGHMLSAAFRYLSVPHEFVIVGLEGEAARALRQAVDEVYLPHLVRAGAAPESAAELAVEVPLLSGREAAGGRPTAYVCSGHACGEPAQSPSALQAQLRALCGNR